MKNLHQDQRGQQLVIMALFMPILIACLAFTVDFGNVYVRHRMVQNAADSASSAGVTVLVEEGESAAEAVAYHYANANGFDNNGTTNTVDVAFPGDCVRATVTEFVPPLLARVIWNGTFTVRAVAAACNVQESWPFSVIVLDPTASKALELSGGAELLTPNGNVHVNSNDSKAVNTSGGAGITTDTPMTIVGGFSGSGISPIPITGAPSLPDPLAAMPEPSTAGCPSSKKLKPKDTETLSPGCYMGGIDISGSADVTFLPGMYLIGGSGLKVSGSATLTADGVTFYIADGDLDFSGGSGLVLTPPSSGIYEGISIFQSRSNTSKMKITGGASLAGVQGTVYAANGDVEMSGGSTMMANLAVRTLKLTGSAALSVAGFANPNWTQTSYILSE